MAINNCTRWLTPSGSQKHCQEHVDSKPQPSSQDPSRHLCRHSPCSLPSQTGRWAPCIFVHWMGSLQPCCKYSWKSTLASAWHSVRGPTAADLSTMSTVRVEHVRKGPGGVALDVAPEASATSKTYSHRHAGKAKNQDQLERHPGARDPKP